MVSPTQLLGLLLVWIPDSMGQIVVTQSPALVFAFLGETVNITCRTSKSVTEEGGFHSLHWYQQKPGQAPRLIMYGAFNPVSGLSPRFRAHYDDLFGDDFTLTILSVEAEDVGNYYCQQGFSGQHHSVSTLDKKLQTNLFAVPPASPSSSKSSSRSPGKGSQL